jgi:hypothetical protein
MKKAIKTAQASPAPATASSASAPAPKTSRVPRIKKSAPPTNGDSPGHANSANGVTVITAKIDIGFGNRLFLRGEGPGLSWEKGAALDCVADDRWVFSVKGAAQPIAFKFLLNDESWSVGDDFVVEPGASLAVTPLF